MKLPKTLVVRGGFTAVEIITVIGVLTVVFAITLPVAWDFYLGYQIDVERDNLVTLLREARNLSTANRNEAAHGLYFDNNNFVVFEGLTYATRNQAEDRVIPRSPAVQISGPSELVFTSLSGQIAADSTYNLTSDQRNRAISINVEGMVDW